MAGDTSVFVRPVRASSLTDAESLDALRFIVESVRELAGFDLVGVSVVREDGYLQVVTIVGPDEAVSVLQDSLAPVEPLLAQLELAEDWGPLKFIPHDRLQLDVETWGWFSDAPRVAAEGQWHPEDMLMAPLTDATGRLVGVLGMELPRDGLIPDRAKRDVLEVYARQAGRAVLATLDREQLAERVRLAHAAAEIVRRASGTMSATDVLTSCGDAVLRGFRASSLWTQLLGPDGRGSGPLRLHGGTAVHLPGRILEILERHARAAWDQQQVDVIAPDRRPTVLSEDEAAETLAHLATLGVESLMLVPLGAGDECTGVLGLTRPTHGAEWTETEATTALGIGRDLGRAMATARTFRREHQLVTELRELDDYRQQLVATVSHELKTPLTSIIGYLELLESDPDQSEQVRSWVAAMQRGGARLSRVVDDLLLLHRMVDSADASPDGSVDLGAIVREVVDLQAVVAEQHGIAVACSLAPVPEVRGAVHELDRVVTNLVGNAVKYSSAGDRVRVSLTPASGSVVLSVSDDGLGISEDDQRRLFSEFYRSSNPDALSRPGTGLGLAIVKRIVDRHQGTIRVDSALGEGSTFTVTLPSA